MSLSSLTPSPRDSPSSPESLHRSRLCSPDGKVLSPDILKRIIEGHEESDIFDECLESRDYAERADLLAKELSKYMQKGGQSNGASKGQNDILTTITKSDVKSPQPVSTDDGNTWNADSSPEPPKIDLPWSHIRDRNDNHTYYSAETSRKSSPASLSASEKLIDSADEDVARLERNLRETIFDPANVSHKSIYQRSPYGEETVQVRYSDLQPRASAISQDKNDPIASQSDQHDTPQKRKPLQRAYDSISGSHIPVYNRVTQKQSSDDSSETRFGTNDLRINNDLNSLEVAKITEKFSAELAKMTSEYERLQKRVEREKAEIKTTYETKLKDMQQKFATERNAMLSRKQRNDLDMIDFESNLKREVRKVEEKYRNEKEDLETSLKSQLRQLNEKVTTLEAENAELELRCLNQRADLEQKFRIDVSELEQKVSSQSREYERSQKFIDFLKDDLDKKKECEITELKLRHENDIKELTEEHETKTKKLVREHEKLVESIKATLQDHISELKAGFERERTAIKEKFAREKSENERALEREKVAFRESLRQEHERDLAAQLKELKKASDEYGLYKEQWQIAYEREKEELTERFRQEKSELLQEWKSEKIALHEKMDVTKANLEEAFKNEKNELLTRSCKQKESREKAFSDEITRMKNNWEADFALRLNRETELLESTVEHLEKELTALKYQKKELETKLQVLELKSISQKHEAAEINQFMQEKQKIADKMSEMQKAINDLNAENESLRSDVKNITKEKTTILDNSVREITEKQEDIDRLQNHKRSMQEKIDELTVVENEATALKRDYQKLTKDMAEAKDELEKLKNVQQDNQAKQGDIEALKSRQTELEQTLQERVQTISLLQEESEHLQSTISNMESIHKKESDAQRERLQMISSSASTEKARLQREIQELRDHLFKANASSDRETELKEKFFNDAKAEVITLNKKLDEKSRKLRAAEESLEQMTSNLDDVIQDRDSLSQQVEHLKRQLQANATIQNERKKGVSTDSLVQELYIENADLLKQVQQAEAGHQKAEQAVRQLAEQKRALQRVISKLCEANGHAM